jgi:hypothetical protein
MIASDLLRRALAGSISLEEFDRKLRDVEAGDQLRSRRYSPGEIVMFRARDLNQLTRPRSASELSYPPRESAGAGRANAEGEQVFYATSRFAPSFMECGLKPGEYVICSRWRNVGTLVLRELGLANHDPSAQERLYRGLFTNSQSSIYAYSAEVARRIMGDRAIAGIVYPSSAVGGQSENFALKPSAVDQALRALDASLYRVKKSDDDSHVLEEIDFARAGANGALVWLGKPARHNGQLKVVTEECEYRAYDAKGKLVEAA